jgi:hypothetical protein
VGGVKKRGISFHLLLESSCLCQQNFAVSEEPARKSHVMTWIVSVLAVMLLYAASWPPIEIKVCGGDPEFGFYSGGNRYPPAPPAWFIELYRPMHFLENTRWGHDPVGGYYIWWQKVL